jgi:hypothetical protein
MACPNTSSPMSPPRSTGPNIRVICGSKRGGHVHWLYSCVMRADLLVVAARQVEKAACEAFTLQQLMEHAKGH